VRAWLRLLLLFAALALFAATTPSPWGGLWLLIPGGVGLSLLATWRWGAWGVLVPVALFAVTLVLEGPYSRWAWWIPATALTGAWMGVREEGGGPSAGERAWMLLPVLLLAAMLPWTTAYNELVAQFGAWLKALDQQSLVSFQQLGYRGERLQSLERTLTESAALREQALPHALPSVLFVWMILLVAAGRTIASRLAGWLKWPELSRARWTEWRLPDAAVWLLLIGLGLVVVRWPAGMPSAWTLLINVGLGYCVQGIAVVESLMLTRGVPPSIVSLTLVFVFAMAMPVFLIATVCVGLSDVWLDYRRLEDVPDGEHS
jgi:Predicted membrane protein (DUF2232)